MTFWFALPNVPTFWDWVDSTIYYYSYCGLTNALIFHIQLPWIKTMIVMFYAASIPNQSVLLVGWQSFVLRLFSRRLKGWMIWKNVTKAFKFIIFFLQIMLFWRHRSKFNKNVLSPYYMNMLFNRHAGIHKTCLNKLIILCLFLSNICLFPIIQISRLFHAK